MEHESLSGREKETRFFLGCLSLLALSHARVCARLLCEDFPSLCFFSRAVCGRTPSHPPSALRARPWDRACTRHRPENRGWQRVVRSPAPRARSPLRVFSYNNGVRAPLPGGRGWRSGAAADADARHVRGRPSHGGTVCVPVAGLQPVVRGAVVRSFFLSSPPGARARRRAMERAAPPAAPARCPLRQLRAVFPSHTLSPLPPSLPLTGASKSTTGPRPTSAAPAGSAATGASCGRAQNAGRAWRPGGTTSAARRVPSRPARPPSACATR